MVSRRNAAEDRLDAELVNALVAQVPRRLIRQVIESCIRQDVDQANPGGQPIQPSAPSQAQWIKRAYCALWGADPNYRATTGTFSSGVAHTPDSK